MIDFAAFQRCLTIGTGTPAPGILQGCGCFDMVAPFGTINLDDLTPFQNCATGAGVAATPGAATK